MSFDSITFEELHSSIADWTMCHKKGAPLPTSSNAEDFIESFVIPETGFEFTQSYVDQNGDVTALFKTSIHLHAWQTKTGKKPEDFAYYKITKAILDNDGNILDYEITGYVLTSV